MPAYGLWAIPELPQLPELQRDPDSSAAAVAGSRLVVRSPSTGGKPHEEWAVAEAKHTRNEARLEAEEEVAAVSTATAPRKPTVRFQLSATCAECSGVGRIHRCWS